MNNDLTFAQQWQAIRNKIDADIQAEGITDLGQVEARVSKNYDSFRDFISNRKKQEALATAYKAGLTPQVVVEGEGGEAKFASYDDKVNDWAELYANQYMAGKKPIDWNTYSTNDRSALIVGTEDAIGRFTHSTEGFLGALGGSFAAMQADLMSRGVFSAQGIPALPPEYAEEITNRAFEQGKEITQSAAGEFARTMIPGLSSVAGEDPNAPELKSERIGSAGSPTASAIGQTIGEAAGGAAQSIPLLMIKDPILRAGATLPYFVMGKYQHQNELYKNEMTARETARRLGIPYEPIPYSQRQLAGTVQGLAEYGSEYIGDSLQIGVLKFDKWLLRGLGAKKFGPLAKELGQSMDRHLGPMGLLKTAGKIAFAGATEAGEEAFSESAKGVNIATPAGFEYEYLSEDVADAALTGGLSGAFLGAGTTGLGGIQKAFDDRAIRRQLEEGGAQADMTQSLVERGQQQAVGTFEKRQVISGSKSRNQDLINFNRNIPVVRGQTMARHQIEELSAGNRLAMFVDPVNQKETITPKLKKEMADAGIVKVGTHQGRAVYAHAAFAADVMQVVAQRNSAAINGYNDLNTDQIMAGAVVLRNDAGHIVHVYPYSDPAEMSKRIPSIVADADARGLTVEDVETGKIGTITDQIQRQVDADAALMRMLPEEQRPLSTQDVTKGISTLRTDIAKSIKGGMADPNAKFVYAKTKKPVRNGSVKLRGITLSRVADQSLSDGERKVLETSTGRAVVLDGTAEYEITNDDGTVEVVQGAIPMDGAFVNQSTPDGVFLVRENGNALTSRSAFVVAWHELRHMIHAKSRAGAAHMARLLSIDPVFAARGGAEYMRNRYQELNGLSDLELIKKLQGLSNAARTTLSSPTATQQQRAEATRDIARFRQFSEESVTTTANQGMGMMTELAAEHEAIYQLRSERSMRAYSAWLANTLVKRGWAGPHARQALYELGQRVRGVRSEEFELHEKFREQTERAAKEAMQQGESRAEAAKGAASAAPAIGAVGASGIGSGIAEAAASLAGEDDEEQQAQPPSDLQTSALQTITDPRLAAIAQMMMAQIAPPSRGISGGPRAQQRERQLRQAEQQAPEVVADEPPSKIDLPLLASIPKPTQVDLRQRTLRNEAQAARVIEGMDSTEELDIGSISRAQRARRYESPSEESLFSVRDRPGRQQANQSVRDLRNRYMQDRGITPEIDITDTYAEVDENFAKRVADWYDSAEVDYADPEMLRAYEAFGKETLDQYKYLRDAGVQMIPWAGTESVQPYANSAQMTRDLRENNRLFYFKTVNPEEAASFGSNPEKFAEQLARNPLLADSGITVLDSEGQPYRQTYNDLFRAVHDVFGHAAEGFQFGPRGEENAYRSHAVMFSPLARGAMATETRSQNSWVNFGPNRRNPDGTVWGEEDPRFQPWKEALNRGEGYADQKPVLTPPEFLGLYEAPQQARASLRPITREEMTPAMRVWSDGSKIVDKNGALIPVYHGTSKDTDFKKFRIGKRGAWFTTNPQEASQYAMANDSMGWKSDPTETDPWASRQTNTASRVIPAVLNLKNPANYYRNVSTEDKKALETSENYGREQGRVFDKLRRQGFDGVDMGNGVYVAFEPNQIKGYYNANPTADERIMYSVRDQKPVVTPVELQSLYSMREGYPFRGKRLARGNQAMINRLNQQVSRGKMSQEDASFGIELIQRVNQNVPLVLQLFGPAEMRREGRPKEVGAMFDAVNERIIVGTKAIKDGDFQEAFTHELWHSLSRFLPQSLLKPIARDYKKAYLAFRKEYNLDPHDFNNVRIADRQTGKTYRDIFLEETEKRNISDLLWYRLIDIDEWLVVNAAEATQDRMSREKEARDKSGPARVYAAVALLIRDMLNSVKSVFGYGVYENLAKNFLRGTTLGMASEPDKEWDSVSGQLYDLLASEEDAQAIRNEQRIAQQQEMAQEPALSSRYESLFDIRKTKETQSDKARAKVRKTKQKQPELTPVQRVVSNETAIGFAPSTSIALGIRSDRSGRQISPEYAQRRIIDIFTSPNVQKKISTSLQSLGVGGIESIEIANGIWQGTPEISARIKLQTKSFDTQHRVANILAAAMMQDAVLSIGLPDESNKAFHKAVLVFNLAEKSSQEIADFTKVLNNGFKVGTVVSRTKVAYVARPDGMSEEDFSKIGSKIASENSVAVDISNAAVQFGDTGVSDESRPKVRSTASSRSHGFTIAGQRLSDQERNSWLDIASTFAHAAEVEGYEIDYNKWLSAFVADPDERSALQTELVERIVAIDGAAGNYGLSSWYLTKFKGDVKGLIVGPKALVGQDTKDKADEFAVIDKLIAKHPDAFKTLDGYQRFMVEMLQSRTIPIAPESHFKRIADNHAGDKQRFRLISPSDRSAGQSGITRGQLDDAIHGMENAEALRKLYSQGVMKPKHTVLLYLWGFLSRGVSPNVQESLLLDMVNFKYEAPSIDVYKYDVVTTEKKDGKETKREEKTELRFKKPQTPLGAIRFKRSKNQTVSKKLQTTVQTIALSKPLSLDFFIDAAIEGKWSDETDTLWSAFVSLMMDKNAFPAYDIDGEPIVEFGEPTQINGSFGAGAVHNANAFGDNFLRNIATIETINGQTKSGLAHIHDEMSKDTATGDSLRRVFAQIPSALGIDNKVVSFNGLVSGLFGIVADRVFMRLAYNANNELRGNIYDGFTLGWNVFINGKLSEFRFNPELPQDTPPDSQVAPFDSLDEIVKVLDVALGTKPARNFNDTTWDRKSTVESLLKEAAKKKITVPSVQFEAVTHKGIGKLWDGTRGIAIYKAFEESIDLQEAFSELIKQEPKFAPHAHMGMYHWLGWVEDSGQEASHQTVEAIMRMATTGNDRIDSVYAKAGKYNSFQYGFEYGYEVVGTSKSGEQILEPRYKITLPDGKTRQFSTKDFKAFQLALKKPANGVVPKNFMISEQKGPWFNSPQLSETNKANLYRLADEMQTQFSVRAGWDQRQSLMRNMRITSVDPERMSRVAMELPFETIGVPSERLPASLEKIKQAFVDRPVPTPVSPEFIEWNRGNKLVGMVPNNIFWHGTGAQFSRYDERPYELGWHVGSIQQITPFVLQNWANKKSAYAMPLYVTAKNPLRLPDRGSWDMRTIVSSMVKEEILTQEDAVQLMQRMTRDVGGELQGSTPLKSFSGRSVSQVSALQRQFTTEWLNSLGYDAIVYDNKFEGAGPDGTNDSVVIWNYGQVKSLSAKQFDPTVPDALFSMRTERGSMFHDANPYAVDAQFSMRRGSLGAKDEFVQQIVDQYDEVLRLQRTIETRTGTALPDASNPYLGMRVLSGRLGSMQQVAERRYATILHDMARHRITLDMMDDFLTAQHALNGGNQYIENLTAGRVLDGTGMSNSDANDVILRAQASGRYAQMNRIAEDWREMLRDALRQRRDSGLITPQLYNTLTTRYTHYVPLQGIANRPEDEVFEQFDEAMRGTGQGQSTTGRGIRRRLGRRSRAMGVTSQVGFMHEETFRRVARNDIGNRFARFVTALNDPNDAEIVRPTARYVAADGSYQYRPDPSWMQDPRMFGLYVDRRMTVGGHTYQQGDLMVIRLTNPRLATAMKQPKTDIGLVGRGLRHLNDAFRFFTTGMGNPQFAPVNAGRDILTSSLMNYTNRGAIDTVQMLARYPFAFARVFKDSWRGRPTGTYAAMQQAGGDMMAWRPNDLELKRIDFDRLAADAQRRDPNSTSVARRLLGWYPAFFSAAETASRLAQFEQRVATGSTKEQAALAAREITVDFAKGGVQKTLLNTLYMFLNAGIQGNANIINSMRRNPRRGAVVASSLVGIGVINAVMARMMAGDDEESGLNRWDMIRNHEKASNLFFFDPRGTGKHIKIPLPYGFNAMVTTGTRIADSVFGPKTGSEAAVDIFTDFLNAFNPVGGSGITSGSATAFNAFVPTAFRPFAEIATNTTFSGAPVYRDSFGKDVVDSATYFDGTPQAYIALAEGLNQFTGGDQYESGSVLGFDTDLSPNVLQYLVGYYFSGTGRLVNQTLKVASGDYSVSDVPLARSFVGQAGTDNAAINELYYEEEAKSLPTMRRAKAAADKSLSLEQRTEAAAGIDPTELRVGISLKETEKALKKLREQMKGATPEQRAAIMKVRQSVMKGALRTRGLTPNQ